ncbi:MAG: fatty acid desaturase [Bdellovibrionota bacterium]
MGAGASSLTALVLAYLLPLYVSCMLGAYLFYIQHNFPSMQLRPREEWTFLFAALNSSSFMEGSAFVHWLTGNIGYHHVHHLNSRIPFYRLPEAMAAIPELQNPGRTSLRPREIVRCLKLKLWDPRRNRMVSFAECHPVRLLAPDFQ